MRGVSGRTFTVKQPLMGGSDVQEWQGFLNDKMAFWKVDYRVKADGRYGPVTRDLSASVCHGMGLASAKTSMAKGVTPDLRIKLRNARLTDAEKTRAAGRQRTWLKRFRENHRDRDVASPLAVILSSSWGFHPPVHDGVDLICKPGAPILAICKARVIRADAGGWWGKGAPADPNVRSKGDGIIVLRCLTDVGPFAAGLNFCYGHAEHATVKEGEKVEAGEVIGRAGLANAWHVHFMVNDRNDDRGVGDRDPMLYVNYARGAV